MRLAILAFFGGIIGLQMQGELPSMSHFFALLVLAMLGFLLAALTHALNTRQPKTWRAAVFLFLLSGAFFLSGFCWASWLAITRINDQLPLEWENQEIEIIGVVASLPQRFERGERFEFDVEKVLTEGASVPSKISLSWYHSWENIAAADLPQQLANERTTRFRAAHPGQRWRLTARLKRPHGNANPHGFDYEAWLLERGIRASGTIRVQREMEKLAEFVPRPNYMIDRLREKIRQRFLSVLPDAATSPYVGVLIALSVGDQRAIPNSQWLTFNRTGVTHLVSISGLHVTMLAALFAALVNFLWRRSARLMFFLPAQKAAVLAAFLAAFSYSLLAGFEVPAQRTFYMLSVLALALWSGRNFSISRVLLSALLIVICLDPWAVLAVGFWLSFGAVSILFFVAHAQLGELPGWRASLARWGKAQWAVTLGSLPLLLFFFQQFSLASPLANALAIPAVSLIITPLALLFAVFPWPPLLLLDHWLLTQLMVFLEVLGAYPMWQQAAPPLWHISVALLGVIWLLLPRGFPARWLGFCLLLPALSWAPPKPELGQAWVDVLDIGQGLAVLVRTQNHQLLYDTGPQYSADSNAGLRVVVPYLRASGINKLDALMVSHKDKDHAGGLNAVQDFLPITRYLSSSPELFNTTKTTKTTKSTKEFCASGQSWTWDGVRFSVLHPTLEDYLAPKKSSNSLSCVLHIATANQSLLLTGDIEAADEKALVLRDAKRLKSDVIVASHHGGNGSSSVEFIAAVGARAVIFSAGYRNPFRHPRPEVRERYVNSQQWRTDQGGRIRVVLSADQTDALGAPENTLKISVWRQEKPRYWQGQ